MRYLPKKPLGFGENEGGPVVPADLVGHELHFGGGIRENDDAELLDKVGSERINVGVHGNVGIQLRQSRTGRFRSILADVRLPVDKAIKGI